MPEHFTHKPAVRPECHETVIVKPEGFGPATPLLIIQEMPPGPPRQDRFICGIEHLETPIHRVRIRLITPGYHQVSLIVQRHPGRGEGKKVITRNIMGQKGPIFGIAFQIKTLNPHAGQIPIRGNYLKPGYCEITPVVEA